MKSFVAILSTMLTLLVSSTAFALSYDTPTCILMKFSNDTRFQSIDSASVLSDLVIEKMLKSEKFNLRETKPIDHDMETQLYREKIRDIENAKSGMISGNFNALFEGPGFDPDLAESIATAEVGQCISPSITSAIGRAHGAQYLIHGTIINLGNGAADDLFEGGSGIPSFRQKRSILGVKTDLRLIKADTGEVVWRKIVTGSDSNTMTQIGRFIKIGTSKLTSDNYQKALEDASQKIVDAMIEDMNKLYFRLQL